MPIRITSKRDGFRRCGIAHTGTVTHADGTFNADQITALKAEPLLVVDIITEAEAKKAAPK
jgi:hypothetical protein